MKNSLLVLILLVVSNVNAQQTVGLFHYSNDAFPGYTIFAPARTEVTYLIDNCGNLQFTWQSAFRPGNSVELMDDGTLIRTCNFSNGSPITGGGSGGRVETIRPDQQIDWFFEYSNDSVRLHHDIELMDNGNILMIAWEKHSQQDAIDYGRDPQLIGTDGLWPDQIIEYNPSNDQIVWEWHAWEHVIQEFDNTKPNYGLVVDHPELFNLNFDKGNSNPDWQHINSIAYNEDLDQILLSSPFWNEIYIIDHSTTTAEASSHSGGNSGRGGDILWRWGNPEMYGVGDSTDQQFYFQHDAHWINSSYPHGDKIIVFNNGQNRPIDDYSTVDIVQPSILPNGDYEMNGGTFLPASPDYIYTAPNPTDFYSRIISSADMLPNGNIIIDEGVKGHYFEIDSLENIVWDYVNPVVADSILEQGETIPGVGNLQNMTFRVRRLAHDFSGVTSLSLVNQGPIELFPIPNSCVTQIGIEELEKNDLFVYPSPASDFIHFSQDVSDMSYTMTNSIGQTISSGQIQGEQIEISQLESGYYFILLEGNQTINGQVLTFSKN